MGPPCNIRQLDGYHLLTHLISGEPINEDEWGARVSEQTPASFC